MNRSSGMPLHPFFSNLQHTQPYARACARHRRSSSNSSVSILYPSKCLPSPLCLRIGIYGTEYHTLKLIARRVLAIMTQSTQSARHKAVPSLNCSHARQLSSVIRSPLVCRPQVANPHFLRNGLPSMVRERTLSIYSPHLHSPHVLSAYGLVLVLLFVVVAIRVEFLIA